MFTKKLIIALLLLTSVATFSQSKLKDFKISGTLISEEDQKPLESATVYLERIKDSSLVTYTISDKNGKFTLEESTYDKQLKLLVSYVGYETISKVVEIDKEEINLGNLNMKTANMLDAVVVKSTAPVTVKKDTLEFNVKSFKTKKDASVEDLLKQLPGVEVDEDGKIKVNGKEVNKILVNGKPFFGNDPTITTRNLTKEIIEKVQITDTKSKSEAFAGEEGDKSNKTINLTIKEENNKGVFGRVAAGAGTDDRYEFAGLLNLFDNDQRLSILAGGNNINSAGFSFGEIRKMFGGGNSIMFNSNGSFRIDGRSFGGGQGIVTSRTIGTNYADELGKHLDITFDYFNANSSSEDVTKVERENILPDRRFFTNSRSNSVSETDNHSANLDMEIEVDSTFLINVKPSFTFNNSSSNFSRFENSLDENQTLTNESNTSSFSETKGKNFQNEIDLTKRFGANGAFFKFGIETQINQTETDDFTASQTNIFGDNPENINRDQFSDGERNNNVFRINGKYRFPIISKKLFFDASLSLRDNKRESIRSTFDKDTNGNFSIFNQELSTNFTYKNRRTTPTAGLVYRAEKWSVSASASYVIRTLESSDNLRPNSNLKETFKLPEYDFNFDYRFSPKASMYSGYSLNTRPPELSQLQPFQDVSNPLNIVTGNPDLEPSNNHDVYVGFNSFDFQKGSGIYGYLNANITENQVVSKTTIDENNVRNTTYTNVNGSYNMFSSVSYNKTVKLDSLRKLRYRIGVYANKSRFISFNNEDLFTTNRTSFTPRLGLTFTWKKVMEIRPSYSISFSKTKFNINDFEDQELISHNAQFNTATFLPKNLEWRNDIRFNYNPNVADGFQKSAWFWNTTLAYSVLKDKGTITLKVYDLLNQNTNARRTATANYIQDRESTVLQQYFMLSFSWKFNSLGKKGETNDGEIFFF